MSFGLATNDDHRRFRQELITEAGGQRRKANTIVVGDVIRLRRQRSMFPMFKPAK
jgi:hypothetical protein